MAKDGASATPENPTAKDDSRTTRERLLDAAEVEFATHGYQGASLRRLTARAGLTLGNVRYIFGGKHELFGVTYHRLFDPLYQARIENLDALLKEAPTPTVEDIFDASSEPVAQFLSHPNGAIRGMFAARGATEHDAFWPFVRVHVEAIGSRFVDALERALGDVPHDEVSERWQAAATMFFHGLAPGFQNVDVPRPPSYAEVERMRRFALYILLDPFKGSPAVSEMNWDLPHCPREDGATA